GRSPHAAITTNATTRSADRTTPRIAAARSQLTWGSHGSSTNRSTSSESTSYARSITIVPAISARAVRSRWFSATIRAASPARAVQISAACTRMRRTGAATLLGRRRLVGLERVELGPEPLDPLGRLDQLGLADGAGLDAIDGLAPQVGVRLREFAALLQRVEL